MRSDPLPPANPPGDASDAGADPQSGTAAPAGAVETHLTQAALDAVVDAATARWAATGLTAEQLDALHAVTFTLDDMPGLYLGAYRPPESRSTATPPAAAGSSTRRRSTTSSSAPPGRRPAWAPRPAACRPGISTC